MTKPKSGERVLKVWVDPHVTIDMRRGWAGFIFSRRDSFKLRVHATLIIPAPKAKRRKP